MDNNLIHINFQLDSEGFQKLKNSRKPIWALYLLILLLCVAMITCKVMQMAAEIDKGHISGNGHISGFDIMYYILSLISLLVLTLYSVLVVKQIELLYSNTFNNVLKVLAYIPIINVIPAIIASNRVKKYIYTRNFIDNECGKISKGMNMKEVRRKLGPQDKKKKGTSFSENFDKDDLVLYYKEGYLIVALLFEDNKLTEVEIVKNKFPKCTLADVQV